MTSRQRKPGSFAWNLCSHDDDQKRIEIKEEALEFGLLQCQHLINQFEAFLGSAPVDSELASEMLGRESLEKWIQDCKDLMKLHNKFQVLVGVAGPTGSGKTSALNALLGFNEILPTNNQEAATAVPCKVAYNDDDRLSMRFKACVTFRTKTALVKQLDQFFEDLKGRDELRAANSNSPEDHEELRNANSNLKPTLEMIRTVFGIEERDIANMTTPDLLKLNKSVPKLLGSTKKFHSGHEDQLAEQIKPYIDSTTVKHTKSGSEFAAWPLIDEVELYVKSDILKNGVVLVDLPGVADSVESRAAVAEAYFPKLVATLIVSPARRAADESTAVRLMSDHQELRMKMDGKFHKRSFCIAVSQTDHIDRRSAVRSREAKLNNELQDLVEAEKNMKLKKQGKEKQLKEARKLLRAVEKTAAPKRSQNIARSMLRQNKASNSSDQIKRQKGNCAELKRGFDKLTEELDDLDSHITFLCIQSRNKFLEDRIQHDFQRRQAGTGNSRQNVTKDIYDGRVSVYPISAKAFWECRLGDKPISGFPDERYSGIPSLNQWIRKATVREREGHADSILYDLLNHFNVIQTWAREEWGHDRLQINTEWLENDIFPKLYTVVEEELSAYWVQLDKCVKKYNPLHDRKESLNNCAGECRDVVQGWSFKNPGDDTATAKIHWLTYQANISRKGGNFVGKSGGERVSYNWMEDISDVLLRTIVADWNQALNHDIPALYKPACKIIDATWKRFLEQLKFGVKEVIPELLPFLRKVLPDIDIIKEQIKDRVRQALLCISKGASEVHPDMIKLIQKKWHTTFSKAAKAKGKGSFNMRQGLLLEFANKSATKMFNAAFEDTKKQLAGNFDRLLSNLNDISTFAIQSVRDHIRVLLNSIALSDVKIEEEFGEKVELQRFVRSTLMQWDLKWRLPGTIRSLHMDDEEVSIPDEYCAKEDEEDTGDEDEMDIDEEDEGADELSDSTDSSSLADED
ncbi:hypothetical protein F4814DRAFT_439350 [Daldinia grandis]|nr:hypothetical protein F4814DRAFT_439350 [Daldinia grandis]